MNNMVLQLKSHSHPAGVTIIEVLTSIIVAVIGVAGVLVIIPFAIRQAEIGLDIDGSTTVGENATAKFEIAGYSTIGQYQGDRILPWVVPNQLNLTFVAGNTNNDLLELADNPLVSLSTKDTIFFIDPLWVSSFSNPVPKEDLFLPADAAFTRTQQFGATMNVVFDQNTFENGLVSPGIPSFLPTYVSLINTATPFDGNLLPKSVSLAAAAEMFVDKSDLLFATEKGGNGVALDDLAPPQPILDRDGAGTDLRRQFNGEISWSAVAVPRAVEGFDFYVLVYKNRSFLDPNGTAGTGYDGPEETDPRFRYSLLHPTELDNLDPADPAVGDPTNSAMISGQASILITDQVDVRNDDWIMLLNYDTNMSPQVGFFRVIGNADDRILLDGSEFIIQNQSTGAIPNRTPTFAIYLRNVIGVFKRQLRLSTETP